MNIKHVTNIINGAPAASMKVQFLLIDGSDTFAWEVTIPLMSDKEVAYYLLSRQEELRCKIYSAQYPGAIPGNQDNETLLESWRRWESNGCKNKDGLMIEKHPWINTFNYDIHTNNYMAVKTVKIKRLLKKGNIARAIKEKGGI